MWCLGVGCGDERSSEGRNNRKIEERKLEQKSEGSHRSEAELCFL